MVLHTKDPYLGHKGSDIIVWSGAADKTISTIANGFFIDKSEFLQKRSSISIQMGDNPLLNVLKNFFGVYLY